MFHNRVRWTIFVSLALFALPSAALAQQTVAADRFVDSAGVNVHLHYIESPYGNFSLIRSRLVELGVRHVRDGLIDTTWMDYYQRFHSLAQAGIRGMFITSPTQSTELWASYPARMGAAFEAYEAPNEYDRSGDPDWVRTLTQTVVRMSTLRQDPRAAAFPIVAPSVQHADSYVALGDLSSYFDAANMHNYLGGRHPGTPGWGSGGYGSIAWNLNTVAPYAGGKPVVASENGYQDGTVTVDAIPQDVAGRYMPRLLLEQFRAGVARTYIYELIDWAHDSGNYGLLNYDGSPKPAFRAVKGLLNLLSDPGPAFTPQPLAYAVHGDTSNLRHMVFQKRDGRYFLALWLGVEGYDQIARRHQPIAQRAVTVQTTTPVRLHRVHQWQGDGSVVIAPVSLSTASFPVTVFDSLTIIELTRDTGAPATPQLSAVQTDANPITLAWTPIPGASQYVLGAGTAPGALDVGILPMGGATQFTVPVPPGVRFYVRVAGLTAQGLAISNEVSFALPPPLAPGAPTLQDARVDGRQVTLTWTPGGGGTPDDYVLFVGTAAGAGNIGLIPVGRTTTLSVASPFTGPLFVRVYARNAHGFAGSNEIGFTVP